MEGDGGGGGGGGVGQVVQAGRVVQAREKRLTLLEELRMLKKAAREQEIRDELEYWRRLHVLATLRDERADLEIEIQVCDVGVAAYGIGPLNDIEEEELAFLRYCIAFKNARVHELGLQISQIQLTVRKAAEIVRLHEQRRAEKDALRAAVLRRSEADRLSALNVSAAVPPKGRCPEGGITRSCLALGSSSNPDGGDTCEVEEVERVDGVEERGGLVMKVEQRGRVEERANVGAGGGVCIIGWEAEHGRKRRCPKRERVKEK